MELELEASHTRNNDYEAIEYHIFRGVPYDRLMSWKPRKGGIIYAYSRNQRTHIEQKNIPLRKEYGVFVFNMSAFKLVRKEDGPEDF